MTVSRHLHNCLSCPIRTELITCSLNTSQQVIHLLRHTPYSKMAAILVFFCFHANWPLWPRSRLNILLNFTFESEAMRANLHEKQKNTKMAAILEQGLCILNSQSTNLLPTRIKSSVFQIARSLVRILFKPGIFQACWQLLTFSQLFNLISLTFITSQQWITLLQMAKLHLVFLL